MNAQKHKDGIYAKTCDGSKEMLLFHVRTIDGKICFTYEKGGQIVASKPMDEVMREIYAMPSAS